MKVFNIELPSLVAHEMRQRANQGIFNGRQTHANMQFLMYCTAQHVPTCTRLIFTRDSGYHSGGWWKNPDYERCYHLSLTFVELVSGSFGAKDEKLTRMWLNAFFSPDDQKKLWIESPATPAGKERDAWHYRLFCDEHWAPLMPRGEVYNTQFTEVGWKSFSEVYGEGAKAEHALGGVNHGQR